MHYFRTIKGVTNGFNGNASVVSANGNNVTFLFSYVTIPISKLIII